MSAITAKASRKMKKYAVLTREPRCFLGSFDFSWEQRKLGDVVQITMGQSPDGSTYSDEPSDYILVQGNADLQNGWVCPRIWTTQITKKADAGDLIMSVRAPAGAMGKTAYNAVIGRGVAAIKGNEFIYQLLVKMDADGFWKTLSCGSTFESLNSDNIKNAEVKIPTTAEQIKIGGYFQQLDNLITLHQRKCALLFSPFQALISMMFTTSTFSWEQRKLGDIGKARSGVGFPDTDQGGVTGVPFFKVSDMNLDGNENEMIVANNYVTAEQIADHRWSPITELPAIFFAKVGAAVMLNRKRLCRFPFLLDNNTMAYSLSPTKWDADFAKALFGTVDLTSLVQVGALPSYNAGDVESMGIYLPSLFEQEQIGAFFKLLDNLITLHQRKCISFTGRAGRLISTVNKKRITSSWEQRKLSEITDKVTEKNAGLQYVETFTNSAEFGIISQRDFFDHDIAKLGSLDGYYIVKNEDFVYNPRISTSAPVGPINRNKLGRTGVMSPLYTVFRPHDIDTTYLEYFFKCGYWHSFMNFNGDSGARSDRFSIRDNVFFQMPIPIPDIDEQRKIGELLTCLDNLITLHQRKPFLMKWRNSDANRNQTNRLVL